MPTDKPIRPARYESISSLIFRTGWITILAKGFRLAAARSKGRSQESERRGRLRHVLACSLSNRWYYPARQCPIAKLTFCFSSGSVIQQATPHAGRSRTIERAPGPADPWHGDLNLSDVEDMRRGHALEPTTSSLGRRP